jgi:hypothetical protein
MLYASEKVLYKVALTANINSNFFRNKTEIKKQLLDVCKTNDMSEYINTSYKFAKPVETKKRYF